MADPADPSLILAAAGPVVRFQGLATRQVVAGARTGGAFALIEHELAPRALGSPRHTHAREDEISHVVAGRLGVEIGGEVLAAGPGDTVVKPRGVPHAFWNRGEQPVRFQELIAPAGFEGYFAEVEPILARAGPPDAEALGAIMARYGLEMDVGSVPALIAAHGLSGPLE